MHELAGRLTALDPDASEALRVIAYFDELVQQRTGLESVVRGAAVLSGAPARLTTPGRRVALRVLPDGRREDHADGAAEQWQRQTLDDPEVTMWLERPGPSGPVDAMVLERATGAVRTILERTRGRHAELANGNGELTELLLDATAPFDARLVAARTLGLTAEQMVRVVAEGTAPLRIVPSGANSAAIPETAGRAGVSHPVPLEDAPAAADAARLALRLAAEGTSADPGPPVVVADHLGAAMFLAVGFEDHPEWARHPDVDAVKAGTSRALWMLPTLSALATAESLRAAATELHVHHSTLQQRLGQIHKALGWDVMTPAGKFRLQVALLLRRLDLTR